MADPIIYELPLNERVRTILRLEFLSNQFKYFFNGTSTWDSRAAVETLLDASILVDRIDLRSELIKELERQMAILMPLEYSPGVDVTRLRKILDDFDFALDRLKVRIGPLAQNLRTDEFLIDIQNRIGLPGGACNFDLPHYHAWLELAPDQRKQDLLRWADELKPVWETAELIIRIIRGTGTPGIKVAEKGFFQMNFPVEQFGQLVRVILPSAVNYYPEMSGDRHRITIHFMAPQPEGRATQVNEDISFQFVCCVL